MSDKATQFRVDKSDIVRPSNELAASVPDKTEMTRLLKKITTKKLIVIILLFVYWASLTLFNYLQTRKSLDDYTAITGKVNNVQVFNFSGYKNSKRHAIVISLNNSLTRFGLQDKYQYYYDILLNKDIIGKRVTIYYNPTGVFIADNLTMWVGQIEIENEIFFPLSSNKDYESIGLRIQLIFLCILTPFLVYVIYIYRKEKNTSS